MPDPFQNVSAASDVMIGQIIEALEERADDPAMTEIIARYFSELDCPKQARCWRLDVGPAPWHGPRRAIVPQKV